MTDFIDQTIAFGTVAIQTACSLVITVTLFGTIGIVGAMLMERFKPVKTG